MRPGVFFDVCMVGATAKACTPGQKLEGSGRTNGFRFAPEGGHRANRQSECAGRRRPHVFSAGFALRRAPITLAPPAADHSAAVGCSTPSPGVFLPRLNTRK